MNYEAELRFVTDALRRYGIQAVIVDPTRPISRHLDTLSHLLLHSRFQADRPLEEYLPPIASATVYNVADWIYCQYMYLRLPDFGQEAVFIIGPFLSKPLSREYIWEQAEKYGIGAQNHRQLEHYYSSIPLLEDSSHLHIMLDTFFEKLWGADCYRVENVSPEYTQEDSPLRSRFQSFEEDGMLWNMDMMEKRYAQENMLMDAVRLGQSQKIETLLSRFSALNFEQRTPDQLRNMKNYCIISNTLMRKAAEQGGVHPVYLDSVSSSFAIRIEQLSSPLDAPALLSEMAKAYCRLVRENSMKGYSATVQKAIVSIDADLTADLSLRHLANLLNVNSSYLSALFKKETGQTVTAYINHQRIRHARHLLDTTKLQIQTIAQHCGMIDVHYFTKVFKNITGMTPRQYRQRTLER